MKIVVLVKEVPDTYGDRKLSLETGLADRGASEAVLDEIGERAIEVALSFADKNPGTEVVVVWGEDPNSRKPAVEAHRQVEVRATVAPAPYSSYARENYRKN